MAEVDAMHAVKMHAKPMLCFLEPRLPSLMSTASWRTDLSLLFHLQAFPAAPQHTPERFDCWVYRDP